jgi:para-nitrobenzyl esterase
MRVAGVDSVEELVGLSTSALLAAQDQTIRQADFLGELLYGPTIDGNVLPQPPLHAIKAGSASEVTLLTGTTLDEARLWSLYNPVLRVMPFGALGRWFRSLSLKAEAIRVAYGQTRPNLGLGKLAMAVLGDFLFWMPQIRLAETQAAHRSDTRMYLISWQTPVFGGKLGSPHAVEIPLVFSNMDAKGAKYLIGEGPDRVSFSEIMLRAWAAFARTGDPSHSGLPIWPAFETTRRATMILDRTSAVQNDPLSTIRLAWNMLPFDGVRPAVEQLPRIADIRRYLMVRGVLLILSGALVGILFWMLFRPS